MVRWGADCISAHPWSALHLQGLALFQLPRQSCSIWARPPLLGFHSMGDHMV